MKSADIPKKLIPSKRYNNLTDERGTAVLFRARGGIEVGLVKFIVGPAVTLQDVPMSNYNLK